MSYRAALLARWSRRDRLAVLIVAVGVAFLVGTALLVAGIGAETTAMAAEYATSGTVETFASVDAARDAAGSNATVLPFATVEANGSRTLALGRPADPGRAARTLVGTDDGATLGVLAEERRMTLRGDGGTVTLEVRPRGQTATPPRWYVLPAGTVMDLGVDGALLVESTSGGEISRRGVPLRTVLAFFVLGTRELTATLGVVAAGSALLVGVVVWSVTRMGVRDRLPTLRVVRATGAGPGTVLGLFGLRSLLLTGVGVALGYALGVIAVNAAVNLAVFLGLPVSIDVSVSRSAARTVGGVVLLVLAVGGLAGVLAAVPAVRRDPAALTATGTPPEASAAETAANSRLRSLISPRLLSWRALVPTTATLSAFVAFVVLIAALSGVVAPLASDEGATVTEPGATHPIASSVPASTVDALEARGIAASGEILLFEVAEGQPYVARGANWTDFARVTDAALVDGRAPRAPHEALIGEDLAATLEVTAGDTVTLGGSTQVGLDRVRVVGVFEARGHYDDELLVSLPVARHLIDEPAGSVQFVRAERLPADLEAGGVRVERVDVPATVAPDESVTVSATLFNPAGEQRRREVVIAYRDRQTLRRVRLAPGERRTVEATFPAGGPGEATVTVGERTATVTVAPRDALVFAVLPERAPPGSRPLAVLETPFGDPVANATVVVDGRTVRTDDRGRVRVPLGGAGQKTVTARRDGREIEATVDVVPGTRRELLVDLAVEPETPTTGSRPTVRATLFNPWNRTVRRTVGLNGPGTSLTREVSVPPGETEVVAADLARRPPGEYSVQATVAPEDGEVRTVEATYTVTGDERVVAALASGGRTGSSGIGRAVETAFGNLRLVLAVVLVLAGGMSVGGTTAGFAQAVQARRRTVGVLRATGATPREVVGAVLADALRVGVVASALAVVLAAAGLSAVDRLGYLTAFGIRLSPSFTPALVSGLVAGALAVTLLGAGLVALSQVSAPPWRLLAAERPGVERPSSGERADGPSRSTSPKKPHDRGEPASANPEGENPDGGVGK